MEKHQIALVGKELLPIYYGVKKFAPDVLHLLVTKQTKDKVALVKRLVEPAVKCIEHVCDAFNGRGVESICESICGEDVQVSFNLTGGTKLMAFAAFHIALRNESQVFYFTPSNEIVDLISYESNPVDISLTNEEIILLSGNTIKTKQPVSQLDASDIEASKLIMEFQQSHSKEYKRISNYVRNVYNSDVSKLPSEFKASTDLTIQLLRDGHIRIVNQYDEDLLVLRSSRSLDLLFHGEWWEVLVASELAKVNNDSGEPWMNVVFNNDDKDKSDKNEVDVLLNIGTKLLMVECKSGNVRQDDLNKMHAVRGAYGGEMSKSVLISYYPLNDALKSKCKELDLEVIAPRSFWDCKKTLSRISDEIDRIATQLHA